MADDNKKFGIEIGTSADTAGLEKTERALRDVEEAGRQASSAVNPMTDGSQLGASGGGVEVFEAKAEAARELADETEKAAEAVQDLGKESAEAEPKLDKVVGLQRAQIALQVGEALGRVAHEVRGLATNLQGANVQGAQFVGGMATGLEGISSAVTGAAAGFSVGGPLGGAIGGMIGLFSGPLKSAISDTVNAFKDLKTAQDNAKTSAENLQRTKQALQAEEKRNFLEKYFQDARREIDLATQAIERQQRVMEATSKADNAVREAGQEQALRSGASPTAVGAADIIGDVQRQMTDLAADVAAANQQKEIAEQKLREAEREYNLSKDLSTTTREHLEQMQAAIDDARFAVEDATAAIGEANLIAEQGIREIASQAVSRVGDLRQSAEQDISGIAAQVAAVEASHAEMSDVQKLALERLKGALADGKITEQESQQAISDLRTILTSFKGTLEERRKLDEGFMESVNKLVENTSAVAKAESETRRRVNELDSLVKTILQTMR
jgi:hypothetical protein